MIILYVFLGILIMILLVLLILLCLKITLYFSYDDDKIDLSVKILCFHIDLMKFITPKILKEEPEIFSDAHIDSDATKRKHTKENKKNTPFNTKKNQKQSTINHTMDQSDTPIDHNSEKNQKIKSEKTNETKLNKQTIDNYLQILKLIIDILDEITHSITFDKIYFSGILSTNDAAKTGQAIGAFWSIYPYITQFLYQNFKVNQYNVRLYPVWEQQSFTLDLSCKVILNTRIIRILAHTKFKNILEIRKRLSL